MITVADGQIAELLPMWQMERGRHTKNVNRPVFRARWTRTADADLR
jgi:hypothetical protein